jgi:Tfp pilus assembly PilM family ATPase
MGKERTVHVYISNSKVQVMIGSCVKNRIQVEQVYEEPLEEGCILNGVIMNSFSLQTVLTQMWDTYKIPAKSVQLVVNGSSITVKPMRIPQTAAKNVPGLIKSEFRDMENIQNMLVDYSIIKPKNEDGSCSILAVLSTKEFVTSYIELFREAKIELSVIDLVQNCLIKIGTRLSSLQNKTFAILTLDKTTLMQSLFSNNDFLMTRRSRILAEPSDPGFEREIGQNINSLIQFNKSEQTGSDITHMYLCGFPEETATLFPKYSENFGIQVRAFPDYLPTELTMPEGKNPADFVVLLGSMIRHSE